jgi:hypothetical protein
MTRNALLPSFFSFLKSAIHNPKSEICLLPAACLSRAQSRGCLLNSTISHILPTQIAAFFSFEGVDLLRSLEG